MKTYIKWFFPVQTRSTIVFFKLICDYMKYNLLLFNAILHHNLSNILFPTLLLHNSHSKMNLISIHPLSRSLFSFHWVWVLFFPIFLTIHHWRWTRYGSYNSFHLKMWEDISYSGQLFGTIDNSHGVEDDPTAFLDIEITCGRLSDPEKIWKYVKRSFLLFFQTWLTLFWSSCGFLSSFWTKWEGRPVALMWNLQMNYD